MDEAKADLFVAGDCLLAFRRGDYESTEASVGAILEAEFMLRVCAFLTKQ